MPLNAIFMPGWMERDAAVGFLTTVCAYDPPLTEAQAENIWRPYREAVEALPEREAPAPALLPLTRDEQTARTQFLAQHRQSPNIRDVIKVDPMGLVVHQWQVIVERSDQYTQDVTTMQGWIANTVLAQPRSHQVQLKMGPNAMDVDVPHGEFMVAFLPNGRFQVQEMARFVTATAFQNRLLLWAGYHRSYARTRAIAPDAIERSLLVVLTTDGEFLVSAASPNQGLRVTLCGRRPPLFGDFFDERFFIRVPVKEKRFVVRVRAQISAVDA